MKVLAVVYKFGSPAEIGGKALGSYDYFLSQLLALKKRGVEIVVLAPWVSWLNKGSTDFQGIKIIRYFPRLATRSLRNGLLYKLINKFYIWRTSRMTMQVSRQEKADIIYVRQARETGAAVARAKPLLGNIPTVFQPITTWQWHFKDSQDSSWKKFIKDTINQEKYAKETLQGFDYFITYNRSMAREYIGLGADEQKFVIIPAAVRHEEFTPSENKNALRQAVGFPLDKKIILYIGRINFAEKGVDFLLRALAEVQKQIPNVFLALVGPGTDPEVGKLKALIAELNLTDTTKYFGSRAYAGIPEFINAADVGVVPSVWFESSGRTSLDMLSCGLPVIVTNVGGLPEYSKDGVTGFIVPPQDEQALTQAIAKILLDDELRRKLSAGARQHVLENYTLEKTTERFIEFLKKLTSPSKF